ncbi:hypothetical protein Zm00014a_032350 [Zea mays]|uniref:Uncharacterized protein n=2 Tax=Zea mays TaxID=4577 RepID=A0A1D6I0L9_MAIZE|nr:hypothetical protein ZEAMMB73_Zm00001d019857 [Zea mays]PWZ04586.1 hypothetical protein Zm00014a_032350 [Zea mays]
MITILRATRAAMNIEFSKDILLDKLAKLSNMQMEAQLLNLLKRHDQEYNVDEISMNDKLTNCGHQITIMEYAGFPFPTVALKVYTSDLTSLFLWTCPRCKGYTKGFEVIYRDHSTCGEG